jgi:peptidoglycan/LPS O-acetylase OafA/YrhL
MPHLDSLRALAVAAVVAHHYRIEYGGVDDLGVIAFGGVRMFFPLSGFLITGILLRSRALCESRHASQGPAIGCFYVRRALRIFPLYYLVVAVALLVDLPPARAIAPWLWTNTLNIHMARQGWHEAHFAHFWSLAVEEQLYLAWPWIVAYVRRRWLLPVVVILGLAAPLSRLAYVWSGYAGTTPLGTYIGTVSSLDALGAGALLAVLRHESLAHHVPLGHARRAVIPALTMLLVVHILPDPRVSLCWATSFSPSCSRP